MVCAGLVPGGQLSAAETNSVEAAPAAESQTQLMVNSFLQLQAQLHNAEIAIEKSREEAAAEAKRNTDLLTARIQTLEDTIAAQRANEADMAQKNQQFTLMMAVAFGLIVVAAVLFMAYLQWRAVARLVETVRLAPAGICLAGPWPGRAGTDDQCGRGTVERAAVQHGGPVAETDPELEQGARATLAEKTPSTANGSHAVSEPKKESATAMTGKNASPTCSRKASRCWMRNEPEKAMECFDVALGLDAEDTPRRWSKKAARWRSWGGRTKPSPVTTVRSRRQCADHRASAQGRPVQPAGALRRGVAMLRTGVADAGEEDAGREDRGVTG